MSLHKEIRFETEICQHLADHGWLYADGDAADYDRARALFPADVLAWVQATQPKAWEVLTRNHGAKAGETLLSRLRDQLDQRGTLDVLRHGIELLGLKQSLKLAEFKPALTEWLISAFLHPFFLNYASMGASMDTKKAGVNGHTLALQA